MNTKIDTESSNKVETLKQLIRDRREFLYNNNIPIDLIDLAIHPLESWVAFLEEEDGRPESK